MKLACTLICPGPEPWSRTATISSASSPETVRVPPSKSLSGSRRVTLLSRGGGVPTRSDAKETEGANPASAGGVLGMRGLPLGGTETRAHLPRRTGEQQFEPYRQFIASRGLI